MPELVDGPGISFSQAGNNLTLSGYLTAVGDYASHAAAMTAAAASGLSLFVSSAAASSAANGAAMTVPHWGVAQVTTANSNKRGKQFSHVSARPSRAVAADHDDPETAFNGDWSKVLFAHEHRISGTATLSQPTTGYAYTPEAYAYYGVLYNTSGWNQGTANNDGRTAACFFKVNGQQYGQGDLILYNGTVFVTGAKSGSTHFLANPAGSLFSGDMQGGAAGVYLNPYEIIAHDNGFDVACIAHVQNLDRTVGTGAKSAWWGGYRVQSIGSVAINNVISATGKINTFLDATMNSLDLGANKALISGKADQRIYLNNASSNENYSTTFNGDYIEYSSAISGFNLVIAGNSRLQVNGAQVTANGVPLVGTDGMKIGGATPATAAGQIGFGNTTATSATAGSNGAVPAQVAGYLTISVGGTAQKIPYFNS